MMVRPARFFTGIPTTEEGSLLGSLLHLSEADSHHASSVLRLEIGAPIELADEVTGVVYLAKITCVFPIVQVCIESVIDSASANPSSSIVLLQALCKGDKNDQIVDWATELGCSGILFWPAVHSVVKLKTDTDRANRAIRLRKIGVAAAKQSRQPRPPIVDISSSLSEALTMAKRICSSGPTLSLFCSLESKAQRIPELKEKAKSIQIVVGPEGDLHPTEDESLLLNGFLPITLGARVLRSELAALTAIISVQRALDL